MSQLRLFPAAPWLLIEDAQGGVCYTPDLVPPDRALDWFERLRADIAWSTERRLMYEHEVDVPRLTARFHVDDPALHPVLRQAAHSLREHAGLRFNSIGLNYYRDGRDSVAMHNDRLAELVAGAPIALLSLGGTRRMCLRAKRAPRNSLHIDLEAGSLLLMSHQSQLHYEHGIPKTRDAVGPRISLALRLRPESAQNGRPD